MVKVTRPFRWHQTFDPKGLSAPVPQIYTCGKTLKNVYKVKSSRKCSNGRSDKSFLLTSKFCPQRFLSHALPCGKNIKNMYKIRLLLEEEQSDQGLHFLFCYSVCTFWMHTCEPSRIIREPPGNAAQLPHSRE